MFCGFRSIRIQFRVEQTEWTPNNRHNYISNTNFMMLKRFIIIDLNFNPMYTLFTVVYRDILKDREGKNKHSYITQKSTLT